MNKTVMHDGLRHLCEVRSPPMLQPYAVTLCLAWQDMELVKPDFDHPDPPNCLACFVRWAVEQGWAHEWQARASSSTS